jgi:anti-sigma-K factor RskA
MDYSRPPLADRLAADYVIGTLRGPARRRFEALLPAHPALRRAVQVWDENLLPLASSIAPVAPPPRVWRRIEARIAGADAARAAAAHVAAATAPRWAWANLALWRGVSGVATLAALSLALLLANPEPARPPLIVVLSPATPAGPAGASFIASISGDGRALVTQPLNVSVPPNRALELWAVPPSGAPRSLGLVSGAGVTVLPPGRLPQGTAALAVSLEPPGGSPTGAPTGPILYVGKLTS